MAIRVTKRKMESNGYGHERIAEMEYVDQTTYSTNRMSRLRMHDWIKNEGGKAFVLEGSTSVGVYPRENQYGTKYVQTYADGQWKDNLLSLPEYY